MAHVRCQQAVEPNEVIVRAWRQCGQAGDDVHGCTDVAGGRHALTQFQGAAIHYRISVDASAARKRLRLHTPGAAEALCPAHEGFSLDAAVASKAGDRRKIERLCRYVPRPAGSAHPASLHLRDRVAQVASPAQAAPD